VPALGLHHLEGHLLAPLLEVIIFRLLVAGAERWARADLTMPQLKVLLRRGERGAARVSWLAERMSVSPPNITGILDRLERRGWIARTADPRDRRVVQIVLTEAGRAQAEAADGVQCSTFIAAGIGPKGAARLLARYGRIEDFPPQVLGERSELALLFKKLATLRTDAPLFRNIDELRWDGPTDKFSSCCERLDAPQLITRADKAIAPQV